MRTRILPGVLIGALFALPVVAGDGHDHERAATAVRVGPDGVAVAPVAPQSGFVTVTGRVIDAEADAFVLDTGSERLRVRMAGWGWYRDDHRELEGELVTVQGHIDGRWDAGRTMTAEALHAGERDRVYFAPGSRVATDVVVVRELMTVPDSSAFITGRVTAVAPNLVRVDSGTVAVDIETDALDRDPTRGEGPFQLREGDRIVAAGHLVEQATTPRSAAGRRLHATTLLLLTEDPMDADAVVLVPDED